MRMRPSTTTAPFPGASTFTGWHSSIAVEQRGRAQLADHLGGVDVGDRRQVERHVAQQLDQHAAEAAHEERAEGRIGRHADQRFEAALHLALEEDALEVGADRSHARHQGVDRGCDGGGGVESEYHAADVTLVDDPGRDRLRHQRKPHALGGGDGFGGRDLLGGGELDAGRAQHGGEVTRREPAWPLGAGEGAVDDGADGALLEPAELEGRAARPRPPAPVPLRGGEGQRRVLRIAVRGELAARPRAEERRRALRGDEDREDRLRPGDGARAARDRPRDLLGVGHQRRDVDHDQRVDVRVPPDELDRAGVLRRGARGGQVDRVREPCVRGEDGAQRGERLRRETRQREAAGLAGIGEQDARPACVRDHAHPRPGGHGLGREERRDVEQLLERGGADHPRLCEEGVHRDVEAREGRRVARGGAGAGRRAARFDRDDRLQMRDLGRDAGELTGVPEALQVEHHDPRARIVGPVAEQVVARDVGLVADRHEGRHPDVQLADVVEDGEAEGAALREHADVAGGRPVRREGGVERDGGIGIEDAHAVRPDHPHPGTPDEPRQALLRGPPRLGGAKPEEITTTPRTPAAAHSSTTPSTAAALTAMTARSTGFPTASTRG